MHHEFWHEKWEKLEIGFHEGQVNALLARHFSQLALHEGARVFMPLCGKAVDIEWIASQGFDVIGVELNESAVQQFFVERDIIPEITQTEHHKCYSFHNIRLYVGDFFTLDASLIGHIDAIYDRAAMVALPLDIRQNYTNRLSKISNHAPILLVTFSYDSSQASGPPFSITASEVSKHYANQYTINQLESVALPNGLKGSADASEIIFLLHRAQSL
ncbi:MAG: thiopurine S-methyltransferase [Alteromonadaceae bacterium]|nr:thiopurine S-methyltransferase [Alteromonadaceae bacterium]